MPVLSDLGKLLGLADRANREGRLFRPEADNPRKAILRLEGSCQDPAWVPLGGLIPPLISDDLNGAATHLVDEDQKALFLEAFVRCRTCVECRRARASRWLVRSVTETLMARRTWFITFTIEPDQRYVACMRAGVRAWEPEMDLPYSAAEFRLLDQQISKEICKFLKRVRKGDVDYPGPHSFRYCLVAEAHKDGFPHYHMLLHEGDSPISKRQLKREWVMGFTAVKLVGDAFQASKYVTKISGYLSKSMLARVRASQRYGVYTSS